MNSKRATRLAAMTAVAMASSQAANPTHRRSGNSFQYSNSQKPWKMKRLRDIAKASRKRNR